MSEDPIQKLRDTLLCRDLSPDEERALADWLAAHPDEARAWKEDRVVGRALRGLPRPAMSTNFTARVMAEIRRETGTTVDLRPSVRRRLWERWRGFLPLSAAGLVLVGGLAVWEFRRDQHRLAEAERQRAALRVLAEISPLALEDFEVIRQLGDPPAPVDFELLAALE